VQRFYKSFPLPSGKLAAAAPGCRQGRMAPRRALPAHRLHRYEPAPEVGERRRVLSTFEQWIKEGKNAIEWTRLSCRSFNANTVRLQLHALAYNLGNFLRALAIPEAIAEWSLTTLREKLIKIGAKVVNHGRYVAFQMAEVAIPRKLFAAIIERIAALRSPPLVTVR
jgi:Transposase DDE domain group 1